MQLDQLVVLRRNFWPLILIAFFPALIRFGVSSIELLYPIRPTGVFLLFVAGAIAFSWQLTSTASLIVWTLRGVRQPAQSHLSFGFACLPKVFIAHSVPIFALFFGYVFGGGELDLTAFFRSALIFVFSFGVFLTWAPVFVAGEFFTKPIAEEEEDEDFDSGSEETFRHRPPRFFSGMSVIDIGIDRSFGFSIAHLGLTVSVLVLGWSAKVVPAALGSFLFGSSTHFGAVAVETFVSSLALGIVMAIAGVTFLGVLPKEARRELELLDDSLLSHSPAPGRRRVFLRALGLFSTTAAVIATLYLVQSLKGEQGFPQTSLPKTFSIAQKDGLLRIKFDVSDRERAFRWLDADRFRLRVRRSEEEMKREAELLKQDAPGASSLPTEAPQPAKGGVLEFLEGKLQGPISHEGPTTASEGSAPSVAEAPQGPGVSPYKLITPKDVLFFSETGEVLDEKFFKPYYQDMKVELLFEINGDLPDPKLVYVFFDQTVQELAAFGPKIEREGEKR